MLIQWIKGDNDTALKQFKDETGELLFALYSLLLKIVSLVEDWKQTNVVQVFKKKKKDPGEISGVTELQMFSSCYSCLNPNSCECN